MLVGRLRTTLAKAEANEHAQVEANRELKKLTTSLEQRVEERTTELTQRGIDLALANRQIQRRAAQLEALAQVMHTISSVRDFKNFYHELQPS